PDLRLMSNMKPKIRSSRFLAAAASAAVALLAALYISIPTARINPADGATGVAIGETLSVEASPLAKIGKVAVYADGELVDIEYNLESGELTRDLGFKAGQVITVEAKVASPIGLTREVRATFDAIEPLLVDEVTIDGNTLAPGARIAPLDELTFHFNKPITEGTVVVDGGESFQLWVDDRDRTVAVLKSFFPLSQGATHSFQLAAEAADSTSIDQELLIDVVRPLSLYGQVESEGGKLRLELYGSVPFRDPDSIKAMVESDLPGADIGVEKQKIIITCAEPGAYGSYYVSLAGAGGIDGSTLELPFRLSLDMRGGQSQLVSNTGTTAGGYAAAGAASGARSGSGSTTDGGPPPGWPPCCPWPPA
ncbi:MAG: hypothetical protein ACYC1B_04465, partial [Thermoleophilia bacterium]